MTAAPPGAGFEIEIDGVVRTHREPPEGQPLAGGSRPTGRENATTIQSGRIGSQNWFGQ